MNENQKITFHNVPSDTFLQQQLCQHIILKSLPPLETKDSLEDIKILKQLKNPSKKRPRKNVLCSFIKATTFETRPRRKFYQQKSKGAQDSQRKSNPEFIHKMRSRKHFDIHRIGKKIINHFKKEISEPGPSQIKKENQNRKNKYDPNKETEKNIIHSLKKLNLNEIKSTSQYEFPIPKKSEILSKSDNSLSHYANSSVDTELMENLNEIQNLFTQKQLDFSSGDVKHLNLQSENACSSKNCTEILSSKKKAVQWNREVDVVYFAGDTYGGKIVKREREPLREEADQQARHKKFIDLILEKNLLSLTKGFHFPYS
ncbi:uncharacterized protein LOC122500642 [Leptopilina heterotoma]|uniref:uncharacterized protein LOC122500642 n=1 Tax=Leptopilina heterotoma TaxID=63436 RepID=UPI001CAA0C5D|nr:uncharacterized protein LOC122500642 [Leptopilina heterotoma]